MYITDKPILRDKDDIIKRNSFSNMVAKSLLNIDDSDTFKIGLYGKWGTGKTSLNEENIIKFLPCTIRSGLGDSSCYEIIPEYQKYITEEEMLCVINKMLEKFGGFSGSVDERLLNFAIAFKLSSEGLVNYDGFVTQYDINNHL